MNLLSYLTPQTIVHTSSNYNRDIRVIERNGKKKLVVNGIQQSGAEVEKFWKFAFSHLAPPSATQVKSILILGVGGGTVFAMLRRLYPTAFITGVDIDAVITDIAKNYFHITDEVVVSDAKQFVAKKRKKYDFVVVDLYIGRDIPGFESSAAFVHDLARISRTVIFNYLHDGQFEKRSLDLKNVLKKEFNEVSVADLPYNRFFLAK